MADPVSFRALAMQALKNYSPLHEDVAPENMRSASAINKQLPRPCIGVRLHTTFPVGRRVGERCYVQVWVYDDPGDYMRIDRILYNVRAALEAMVPIGSFLEARWIETGVDLRDDPMEAITRYSRFQMTGTYREAS